MDLDVTALQGVADLTLALNRERRLIGELQRAMLQQRQAVGRADVSGIEASLRLASRVLLTIQETQRYRATLLQHLVDRPDERLEDLDGRFGAVLPDPFLDARRKLRTSATELAEAVWCNQGVLLDALREREAMLRELLTGSRPASPAVSIAAG